MSNRMPDRMSHRMPERMSDRMSEYMWDRMLVGGITQGTYFHYWGFLSWKPFYFENP